MNQKNRRGVLLEQLVLPESVVLYPSSKSFPATRKGKTLADFYTEVFKSSKPLYDTKSAKELEIMMMKNRQMIEIKNKKR